MEQADIIVKLIDGQLELIKHLRDVLNRLQAIEDKIDSLDERMADIDRIELLRQYDD